MRRRRPAAQTPQAPLGCTFFIHLPHAAPVEPRSIPPVVGLLLIAMVAAVASALGWLLDGPTGTLNILAALTAAGLAGFAVRRIPMRF